MSKVPRLFFFDFECFSKSKDPITGRSFWLVIFIEYKTRKGKIIINNDEELAKFYNKYKDDIFIGFNSRSYDQFLLKGLLLGIDAGFINDKLIIEGKKGFEVVRKAYTIPFNNFDIMPNPPIGLKTLEGFMGSDIKESSIPFDLNRPLTEDEIKETIKYCIHDVRETMKVFDANPSVFDSQLAIIDTFELNMTLFNKTEAQLSASILGAKKHENRGDEFDFIFPDTLKLGKYEYIKEWYENPEHKRYEDDKGKKMQLKTEIGGIEHVLGYGGIHAAKKSYTAEGIILCGDVASLYPSLTIRYNYMSRNVDSVEKYKNIRDERLRLKALKDNKQLPYKKVLNATTGAFKDKYNDLYDPRMNNSICVGGQLLLIDLIEKVESYGELIQSNTDGIYMKVDNQETVKKIKEISSEWETRTGLELEWDEYIKIVQKDVNNYILIPEKLYDGKGKPKWKTKGAYIKKLNDLDYDLPIVNKALVDYFLHNTPVEETINNCNELREFQKVVKVSSLYLYGLHGEEKLNERVLRVFADNRENAKGVFKVKRKTNKEGITQDVPEKIGNTPDRCFIDNDDIKEKLIPEYLDKSYYIDLAQKRLNDFLGIKKKKPSKKKKKIEEIS